MPNGTASPGQLLELASSLTRQLPRDISSATAQYWQHNQRELQERLRSLLMREPFDVLPPVPEGWELLTVLEQDDQQSLAGVSGDDLSLKWWWLCTDNNCIISLEEFFRRARTLQAYMHPRHIAGFLRQQTAWPSEWQRYCIIFPGQIWKTPQVNGRGQMVTKILACSWLDGVWHVHFVDAMNLHFKLVRCTTPDDRYRLLCLNPATPATE